MSGRPARSSYQTTEGARLIDQAISALKDARAALLAAGCQAAVRRVRAALRSAEGARRHAINLEMRAARRAELTSAVRARLREDLQPFVGVPR